MVTSLNILGDGSKGMGSPASDTFAADSITVLSRAADVATSRFRLSDGTHIESRRYLALGAGDHVSTDNDSLSVFVKRDKAWLSIAKPWTFEKELSISQINLKIRFKEIESEEEIQQFNQLRQFHYRGGGGAGRIVPIIGTVEAIDLPRVIGFIELSSSMIANTARKRFFDGPYREESGLGWNSWDRATSKEYSGLICRISRFVIHPELRGLGLAAHFIEAARDFARERWHYGGYRPRFLEITADMLKYYPFVDSHFISMGETEGNEHRVSKDMSYLVKKALSDVGKKAMPQGGGGIMSLQRGYATMLLAYMASTDVSLDDAISRLQYDPSLLDQHSWEALHRLNRRPKPCYILGLTETADAYVRRRAMQAGPSKRIKAKPRALESKTWDITGLSIDVSSEIIQTTESRIIQDAFGFVGSSIGSTVISPISFSVKSGAVTLICGASGSGKSTFLASVKRLLAGRAGKDFLTDDQTATIHVGGVISNEARVGSLQELDGERAALELIGPKQSDELLRVSAQCGLAEPQLLVRPTSTLSSGQKYRLQVALAFLRKPEVILVDNFCESLDRFSVRAVCRGMSRLARDRNVALIVATAAYDRILHCITPDQTIMLRRGDDAIIQQGGGLAI